MTVEHWGHNAYGEQIRLGREPRPGDCFKDIDGRIMLFTEVSSTGLYKCQGHSDAADYYCQPEYLIWLPEMHYGEGETKC